MDADLTSIKPFTPSPALTTLLNNAHTVAIEAERTHPAIISHCQFTAVAPVLGSVIYYYLTIAHITIQPEYTYLTLATSLTPLKQISRENRANFRHYRYRTSTFSVQGLAGDSLLLHLQTALQSGIPLQSHP